MSQNVVTVTVRENTGLTHVFTVTDSKVVQSLYKDNKKVWQRFLFDENVHEPGQLELVCDLIQTMTRVSNYIIEGDLTYYAGSGIY